MLSRWAPVTGPARRCLAEALGSGRLSARGYHRLLRVARTLADLRGDAGVLGEEHVLTALALRGEVDLVGVGG